MTAEASRVEFSVIMSGARWLSSLDYGEFERVALKSGASILSVKILSSVPSLQKSIDNLNCDISGLCMARLLAQRAFRQSQELSCGEGEVFGIGFASRNQTGTDTPTEAHVCIWGIGKTIEYTLRLGGLNAIPRTIEQSSTVDGQLKELAILAIESMRGPKPAAEKLSGIDYSCISIADPMTLVLNGDAPFAVYNAHGDARSMVAPFQSEPFDPSHTIRVIYPGSFRPLHWGHRELATAAIQTISKLPKMKGKRHELTFEISTCIADKNAAGICESDLRERVSQFTRNHLRIAVTNAKLFTAKAELFPGSVFVVGVDTARRIVDKKYYNDSPLEMARALGEIRDFGCCFLVGGRQDSSQPDGWDDLSRMSVPSQFEGIFHQIPSETFRVDISSTDLRRREQIGVEHSLKIEHNKCV